MPIRQSICKPMAKPKPRATWNLRPGMSPGQEQAYMSVRPGLPTHYFTEPNDAKASCDEWNAENAN